MKSSFGTSRIVKRELVGGKPKSPDPGVMSGMVITENAGVRKVKLAEAKGPAMSASAPT